MGRKSVGLATSFIALVGLAGCGSKATMQQCTYSWPLTVIPSTATLDHTATGAGNTVQFRGIATQIATPATCPSSIDLGTLVYANWSNPDPQDIQISSADNGTNGVASCINATSSAVTLTGTFKNYTAPDGSIVGTPENLTYVESVTLTCK